MVDVADRSYTLKRVLGSTATAGIAWRPIPAGHHYLTLTRSPLPFVLYREKGNESVEKRLFNGKTQEIRSNKEYEWKPRAIELDLSTAPDEEDAIDPDFFRDPGGSSDNYRDKFTLYGTRDPMFVEPDVVFLASQSLNAAGEGGGTVTIGLLTTIGAKRVVVTWVNNGAVSTTVSERDYNSTGIALSTAIGAGAAVVHTWGEGGASGAAVRPEMPTRLEFRYTNLAASTILCRVRMIL